MLSLLLLLLLLLRLPPWNGSEPRAVRSFFFIIHRAGGVNVAEHSFHSDIPARLQADAVPFETASTCALESIHPTAASAS
ncbi:hypothetical protein P8609_06570 [Lysobacter sp. UC]|uniref:Secreted protein n=1 Tax=Lysobacter arvi TaxID=3038776 RepID=A0ABU1CE17_9GAMM|nr:hypothetical protein [Lysobacter arvi]